MTDEECRLTMGFGARFQTQGREVAEAHGTVMAQSFIEDTFRPLNLYAKDYIGGLVVRSLLVECM